MSSISFFWLTISLLGRFDLESNKSQGRSKAGAILCDFTSAVVGQKIPPPQPGPLGRLVNKRTHTWRDGIFCAFCRHASCEVHDKLSLFHKTISRNYDNLTQPLQILRRSNEGGCVICFYYLPANLYWDYCTQFASI